jgi:4-hydroxy-3-polyprenylbenzoate decarboxylase
MALGLGCETYEEARDRWQHGLDRPLDTVMVEAGPVHDEIVSGEAIASAGLDLLPVPVEEPGFSQIIRVGLPVISRDPETGVRNMGTYNAFLRDRDRIVLGASPTGHLMRHWRTAKARGEDLPVAIVIGATPNILFASSTRVPYGVDELAIAGGVAGEPVQMVRCKTIPLEVPAHAEIVIEGLLSTKTLEPRLGFGEYPGYINPERNTSPVLKVTALTHRREPIFTPILVGFPPVETTMLAAFVISTTLYHHLRVKCGLPVRDAYINGEGGGITMGVIQVEKGSRANPWQILQAAASQWEAGKYLICVDSDINPRDLEVLVWALQWRVRPEADIQIQRGRRPGLDPSFGATGSSHGEMDTPGTPRDYFRVLIDATMKGPYPPVALPAQDFMERAVEMWRQQPDLPELRLREPWFGYKLGYWSDEDEMLADLIARGQYRAVGDITAEQQTPADQAWSPASQSR